MGQRASKLHLCILTDVYPPEPVTAAFAAEAIAQELVERGHDVDVLSPFPNRPAGRLLHGERRRLRKTSDARPRVIHTWHTLSRRSSMLSRGAENVSFGVTSGLQLLTSRRYDAIYMNTWPIVAQTIATKAAAMRSTPVIGVVHDLYPETLELDESLTSRGLMALDRSVYRRCSRVTALTDAQAEHLERTRSVAGEKITVVPDWVDPEPFEQAASEPEVSPADTKRFLARYVGALTRIAQLETLIDAAEHVAPDGIDIELVGDGASFTSLQAEIDERGLKNIRILRPLLPEDVPKRQREADALILSLMTGAATTTMPSKLMFYMWSGRPVLAAVAQDSAAAELIERSSCGLVSSPGDGKALAKALRTLAADPLGRKRMGDAGIRYARRHFNRATAVPRVADLIEHEAAA